MQNKIENKVATRLASLEAYCKNAGLVNPLTKKDIHFINSIYHTLDRLNSSKCLKVSHNSLASVPILNLDLQFPVSQIKQVLISQAEL